MRRWPLARSDQVHDREARQWFLELARQWHHMADQWEHFPPALFARQKELRQYLIERSLGGLPPRNTPLEAQIVGSVEGNDFRIGKVIFQSRPHCYVTANLYCRKVSKSQEARSFLLVATRAYKGESQYQIVCQYLAQAGLLVLAYDPIGQGERCSYYEPTLKKVTVADYCPEHDYAGAQCQPLGDNIARYFAHDSMRAVDYLCSRPEVNPDLIGMTGNSGGGLQTCLMMMVDARLAAAAPGTFVMNRETHMHAGGTLDAEQVWAGFTAAGYDHEDMLSRDDAEAGACAGQAAVGALRLRR
jgi:hypothetical protein